MNRDDLIEKLVEARVLCDGTYNSSIGRWLDKDIKDRVVAWAIRRHAGLRDAKFAEQIYWLWHDLSAYPKQCSTCRTPITHFHSFPIGYKRDFCSNRCAQLDPGVRGSIEATLVERFGVSHQMHAPEVRDRIARTNLGRYGHENPFGSDSIKALIAERTHQQFGVANVSQAESVKVKKSASALRRYGVEHPTQDAGVKAKIRATHLSRYGRMFNNPEKRRETLAERWGVSEVAHIPGLSARRAATWRATVLGDAAAILDDRDALIAALEQKDVVSLASDLGVAFSTIYVQVKRFGIDLPPKPTSRHETSLREWLSTLDLDLRFNDRNMIKPLEIDILIPEHKIGIEMNGLWWHSDLNGKTRSYHLSKLERMEAQGWKLIHLFEDEWRDQPEIVKSRILAALGRNDRVMARCCTIEVLPAATSMTFMAQSHIQGPDRSSVRYGLLHEGEMVAAMTFVKSRFNKAHYWELSRFASRPGVNVVGGASRLFARFVRDHAPRSIISYACRRFSQGGLYRTLGFQEMTPSPPNYYYVINAKRESRIAWQKHKLAGKIDNFDPALSEAENMRNAGIPRIYDCGNLVFVWSATT